MKQKFGEYALRSEFYHLEQDGVSDFEFYEREVREHVGPVLVIPCGAGRLLGGLANYDNIEYADLEPQMINKVRERLVGRGKEASQAFVADMFCFKSEYLSKYELIILSAEVMQMFSLEDVIRILGNFTKSLSPTGYILMDIANFSAGGNGDAPSYYNAEKGNEKWLSWRRELVDGVVISRYITHFDSGATIDFIFDYLIERPEGVEYGASRLKIWRHSREAVKAACWESGLEIIESFDGYNKKSAPLTHRVIYKLKARVASVKL